MSLVDPYREGLEAQERELANVYRLSAEQLSEIHHTLQNRLAAIAGFAELLCTRKDEEAHRQAPALILEAAEQLTLALEDMFTLFALDTGALVLDVRTVDLGAILADVLAAQAAKTGRRLPADCHRQACLRVEGDPLRLAQVLRHVIDHACAHASAGAAPEVVAGRDEGFAIVSVAFVPRPESPARSPVEVGGMRLAIAQGLIALHGGELWTAGELGRGAMVSFSVPLDQGEELP